MAYTNQVVTLPCDRHVLSRVEENNNAACDYDGGDCEWILCGCRQPCLVRVRL